MKHVTLKIVSLFGVILAIWVTIFWITPNSWADMNTFQTTLQKATYYSAIWIVVWFLLVFLIARFSRKSQS